MDRIVQTSIQPPDLKQALALALIDAKNKVLRLEKALDLLEKQPELADAFVMLNALCKDR